MSGSSASTLEGGAAVAQEYFSDGWILRFRASSKFSRGRYRNSPQNSTEILHPAATSWLRHGSTVNEQFVNRTRIDQIVILWHFFVIVLFIQSSVIAHSNSSLAETGYLYVHNTLNLRKNITDNSGSLYFVRYNQSSVIIERLDVVSDQWTGESVSYIRLAVIVISAYVEFSC